MNKSQQLLQVLEALDPFEVRNPLSKQEWIAFHLREALRMLNYHRVSQWRSGGILGTIYYIEEPQDNREKAAIRYLMAKRIFTPTRIPRQMKQLHPRMQLPLHPAYAFRVDFERAVAYYRILFHRDPDFLRAFPEPSEDPSRRPIIPEIVD